MNHSVRRVRLPLPAAYLRCQASGACQLASECARHASIAHDPFDGSRRVATRVCGPDDNNGWLPLRDKAPAQ